MRPRDRSRRDALDTSRRIRARGWEARILWVLADIAAGGAPADFDEAHDLYREARALADDLGMRPLTAHCHLGIGKLYRRMGNRQQAQEHLTTATMMYREMGMGVYLAQAETQLNEST